MNNEVLNAIKTRRSIRKYKAEQITDEQLSSSMQFWRPERMRQPAWENSRR